MNVLLTSCGLETEVIEKAFLNMLPKPPEEVRAMFIPTAAVFPGAVEVLPKCLHDLLRCGIPEENISVCDLHLPVAGGLSGAYDVVYLCGGSPEYLLKRVNEAGFREKLLDYIGQGGVVVGVSAGSMIFAGNMENNLGLLSCAIDAHCGAEARERAGRYPRTRQGRIKLGDNQAIIFDQEEIIIIE